MKRVCVALENNPLETADGLITLTTSIGATIYIAGETPDATVSRADQALYEAKNKGRNQVQLG